MAYNAAMPTDRLLWARFPLPVCPECGRSFEFRQATLGLHLEDQVLALELTMGYCATDNLWLADLVTTEEALEEVALNLLEVKRFSVDSVPVDTALWMGEGLGAIPWALHRDAMAQYEPQELSLEEIRGLPQVEETWLVTQAAATYFLDDKEKPALGHLGLVATSQGLIRSFLIHSEPLGRAELTELVTSACAQPPQGLPSARPHTLRVADPSMRNALTDLETLGISVAVGDVNAANEALEALEQALTPEPTPSYFVHYLEPEVKAFFKAAASFFQARPWEVIDGYKFIAFRLDDGPWRYANVMGQAEEEYGLAVFRNWLEVCKTTNNPETIMDMLEAASSPEPHVPKSLLATGGAEGLSLSPLDALAPEDAAYLNKLKVKASWRRHYATVHRYTPYGLETPQLDLSLYTGLMSVLSERARKIRGNAITSLKTTLKTPKGQLSVRYPAKGDEAASKEDYYRFRVPFKLGAQSATPGELVWAEVSSPGEAKWHRVMSALTREAKKVPHIFPWVSEVSQGEYALWIDQAPVKEPSPTVEQLAKVSELTLKMGLNEQPSLRFEVAKRPEPAEITVRFDT